MGKSLDRMGLLAAIAPYIAIKLAHYIVVNSTTTGMHSLWALVWCCLYAILGWQTVKMLLGLFGQNTDTAGINLDTGTFYALVLGTTALQILDDFSHNTTATGLDSVWRLISLVLGAFIVFFLGRNLFSSLGEMVKPASH